MTRRIVIISDTQIPYDHRRAVKAVIRYIADTQPDEVVHIGDLMDFPQPSRWSKGTAAEFEGSVLEDCEQAKRRFLAPLREVYEGPIGVHEGNHDLRPREYLSKYAPALAESGAFDLPELLDFNRFGVSMLPEFYHVAPGWVTTHGHRGGIRLSQESGKTALNAVRRFGTSVAMGHTHRLAAVPHTTGYGAQERINTGFEVGHLMDMKQAQYLKGATANWQMGFGILTVDGNHVRPEAIPITANKFTVDGRVWQV
ncbi:metallophosphoesterase [Nocardia iowensis]|uniref:Metallophosphoesterase family protein n=1 Tax=Nocardia iowensis TaxID=204891 RepID=A0ABX8RSK0_NOCIO|nr:metallophosphoesterase [Nocardia iowensis]QXN92593.1 metallophosphoesterase family protein [Nocardia iowensis]